MAKKVTSIQVKKIRPGKNDRTVFNQAKLKDLAESIRLHNLTQPITVRKVGAFYEIIAGERRFRAVSEILKRTHIDAIIIECDDRTAAALMLSENTSREDLDPIDEANAFQIRIDHLGWTVEECAISAGVSQARVQLRIKLLRLRADIQSLVRSGNLQIGYAQILADGNLDVNRQSFAIKALQNNAKPTPGWFKSLVGQYAEQQNQAGLFDIGSFLVCQELPAQTTVQDPPHPSTTAAPILGTSPADIVRNQASYWRQAAGEWDQAGKPFKRQECEAAALALESIRFS